MPTSAASRQSRWDRERVERTRRIGGVAQVTLALAAIQIDRAASVDRVESGRVAGMDSRLAGPVDRRAMNVNVRQLEQNSVLCTECRKTIGGGTPDFGG